MTTSNMIFTWAKVLIRNYINGCHNRTETADKIKAVVTNFRFAGELNENEADKRYELVRKFKIGRISAANLMIALRNMVQKGAAMFTKQELIDYLTEIAIKRYDAMFKNDRAIVMEMSQIGQILMLCYTTALKKCRQDTRQWQRNGKLCEI